MLYGTGCNLHRAILTPCRPQRRTWNRCLGCTTRIEECDW
jgi:hypothetical protein